jgi:predicted transporter
MTLAAPTVGADDGVYIAVYSSTAFAHTITATGLFVDGSGNVNKLTYAAHAGALAMFQAYQGVWYVDTELGVTSS